ncbi:MAG TPA: hypothetical protein VFF69_05505 [Phycisphaerales bacterium]|nr:hypothetical protein [Phycisphaerales bacterium]
MPDIIDYCTGGEVIVPNTSALQQYATIQGDLLTGADAADAYIEQSRAGTLSNLRVYVLAHGRGPTTVTLEKTGDQPTSPLQISFDDDNTFPALFEDNSNTVSFDAGDKLRWLIDFDEAHPSDSTILSYISVKVEFA